MGSTDFTSTSSDADGAANLKSIGATKASFRTLYDYVSRRLEHSGLGDTWYFLNHGYVSQGAEDEAPFAVPDGVVNPNSMRLALEVIGPVDVRGRHVLDVGCGRGGTTALLADQFQAKVIGVDISPESVAFCRRTHRQQTVVFEVGDAERLPVKDGEFDAIFNIESSHAYPNLRKFFAEVHRALNQNGWFLYADLLPTQRWPEVRALLTSLRFIIVRERAITANVLASCDVVVTTRAEEFGRSDAIADNFLAVPGSAAYEQMRSGAWEYRILRSRRVW